MRIIKYSPGLLFLSSCLLFSEYTIAIFTTIFNKCINCGLYYECFPAIETVVLHIFDCAKCDDKQKQMIKNIIAYFVNSKLPAISVF